MAETSDGEELSVWLKLNPDINYGLYCIGIFAELGLWNIFVYTA